MTDPKASEATMESDWRRFNRATEAHTLKMSEAPFHDGWAFCPCDEAKALRAEADKLMPPIQSKREGA
jgi:hypothetical protein